MSNQAGSGSEERPVNVQVAVRCRPANEEERKGGQPLVISTNQEKKTVDINYGANNKKQSKTYSFDKVFGAYSTQEEVFDQLCYPIVEECLAGFNCTIFAYGQTGTGKTHTMEGSIHCDENAGIVPRSIKAIFDTLTKGGAEFTVRVSFLELYNEELQDLLTPSGTGEKRLKLCEVEKKGVVVQNLEEVTVLNANDIFEILQKGIQQRATAATNMNKNSSRSHSIFTLKIMIKEQQVDGEEVVRHGQLNLVDLAGSECVGRSGAKNDRAREAGNINQSLLTLGRVITALVDHHGHIPYRDSKLTRLLQESLGGKAKTCIIATLSPSQLAVEETMSTLDYAHKAKNIKNQPLVNQRMTKKTVLKEYCEEIESLRTQLQLTREKNGVYVEPEKFYAMEQRIASQDTQIVEVERVLKVKQEEHKAMKAERDEMQATVGALEVDLADTISRLESTANALERERGLLQREMEENKANQCVIAEQVVSEKCLTQEGLGLQQELGSQRAARTILMSKVEYLSERELRRNGETMEFIDGVMNNSKNLCNKVDGMLGSCNDQRSTLCDGVKAMLSRGKDTCDQLNKNISIALAGLVNKTNEASVAMEGNCTSIQTGLAETDGKVSKALLGLQADLSAWLGGVGTAMTDTVKFMEEQEATINEMKKSLSDYQDNLQERMAEALEREQRYCSDREVHYKDLEVKVRNAFNEQKEEAQKRDTEIVHLLNDHSDNIRAAIGNALEKVMKDTTEMLHRHSCKADARIKDTTDMVVSGLQRDAQQWNAYSKEQTDAASQVKANSVMFKGVACEMLDLIGDKKRGAECLVSGVNCTIDNKRQKLNETADNLLDDVHTAVNEARRSAVLTAKGAVALKEEVNDASDTMQAGAASSIDSFDTFLDNQGSTISNGIISHFTKLDEDLQEAKADSAIFTSTASTYSENLLADKIIKTGSTPEKQTTFPELVDLNSLATREHGVIRHESFQGTWTGPDGTKETAPAPLSLYISEPSQESSQGSESTTEQEPEENSEEDTMEAETNVQENQEEVSNIAQVNVDEAKVADGEIEERSVRRPLSARNSSSSSKSTVSATTNGESANLDDDENQENVAQPGRGRTSSRAGAASTKTKSGLRAPSRTRARSVTRLK